MKRITLIIMLLFLNVSQKSYGETISIEQAIETGIKNDPKIESEIKKIGIRDADIKEAGMLINPKIILDGSIAENSYKAGISQTIELGGKRKKRIKAARIEREILIEEITEQIINLRAEIRNAYIGLYCARERQKAAREILELTEKLTEIAKKREKAGQVAMLDVLQTEITVLNAKNEIEVSELEVTKSYNELNSKLNGMLSRDIELEKPNPEKYFKEMKKFVENRDTNAEIQKLIEIAETNRPELKRIKKKIEKAEQMEKLARVSSIPDITIAAGPDIVVEKENKTTTKVNIFASIDMDVPIFNHGQGELMKARAEKEVYSRQILAEKRQIDLEIRDTYYEIIRNIKSIQIYETELIPKALNILKKSEKSFQEGKSSILTPINAQNAFIEARKNYINMLENYYKSLNKLERAIGAVNNEDI